MAQAKKSVDALRGVDNNDDFLVKAIKTSVALYLLYYVSATAYRIRLQAINEYGTVIHEFDPYFNFRATEYLYWNGWRRFFQWFDYMVWYPLGRPVGTTIYPGMQFTAVWIKVYIIGDRMSLNDICCYIPAWFGTIATIVTGSIAYECSLPTNSSQTLFTFCRDLWQGRKSTVSTSNTDVDYAVAAGLMAMFMMAIVPAHLMRSMGGGFDNESIAMSTMVLTFYFWVRSLRTNDPYSFWWSVATSLAYFYMAATWGGYVFVLNLIGMHAAVLVASGRFDFKVYMAYSIFYVIGTSLVIQLPVIGWTPLKSLEQLGPCAVFLAYQLFLVTENIIARKKTMTRFGKMKFRATAVVVAGAFVLFATMTLAPKGYFGPITARVRGLFVKHTKTGNPLVDSVAEHQPANSRAYFQYLHHVCTLAPVGFLLVLFKLSDASSFLIVWASAAYFFSHKMVRLILLTAPIASILGGIVVGRLLYWCIKQWWSGQDCAVISGFDDHVSPVAKSIKGKKATANSRGSSSKEAKNRVNSKPLIARNETHPQSNVDTLKAPLEQISIFFKSKEGVVTKRTVALVFVLAAFMMGNTFVKYCWRLSEDLSNPTIILKGRLSQSGQIVKIDDYREAYWWLRDNTPVDARILAWWDYGYQIAAIANRTSIADGNTWNHEHIALLGKAFTADLEVGWEISRHLADFVLIWAGGGGDDLAKSPHLARIANSVYRDHCPNDPTCRAFAVIDRQGTPSSMMRRSFVYNLHGHKLRPNVNVPENRFINVFNSKYGKVRIYQVVGVSQESKDWVANPANRICDAPGSWYCRGQYPPGLKHILDTKTDFHQLEDFNRVGKRDDEYTKQYFEDLNDPSSARKKALEKEKEEFIKKQSEMSRGDLLSLERKKAQMYETWQNSEAATRMLKLINDNNIDELTSWLTSEPHMAFIRSEDGRGPMWWAFEARNEKATKLFLQFGVPHSDRDAMGMTPRMVLDG